MRNSIELELGPEYDCFVGQALGQMQRMIYGLGPLDVTGQIVVRVEGDRCLSDKATVRVKLASGTWLAGCGVVSPAFLKTAVLSPGRIIPLELLEWLEANSILPGPAG